MSVDASDTVGQNLEIEGIMHFGSPTPAGLQVTLTSNNTADVAFSLTATGAGSPSLTFTPPAGSFQIPYFVYGLNNVGSVTITAMATGYNSGTGSVTLAPSGIVIDPNANSPFFPLMEHLAAGTVQIPVQTAVLVPGSLAYSYAEPLAGGLSVTVSLTNSNPTVGTITSPVIINGGSGSAATNFTPLASGTTTTTIGVTNPTTATMIWSTPTQAATINVQVIP
jgi:hypothetical protein